MKRRKLPGHVIHKRHKHRNLVFLFLSLAAAFTLSRSELFHSYLLHLGSYGYLGAFIGGMLFASTFTIATGMVILIYLGKIITPIELGAIAGLGAVASDIVIFHVVKDNLMQDITPIYNKLGGKHLTKLLHTKYFSWTLPVLGALIIASPLPDELGVSLMGLSKMKLYQFLPLSFLLNSVGILSVISASAYSF